jgi:hypothetical protein
MLYRRVNGCLVDANNSVEVVKVLYSFYIVLVLHADLVI